MQIGSVKTSVLDHPQQTRSDIITGGRLQPIFDCLAETFVVPASNPLSTSASRGVRRQQRPRSIVAGANCPSLLLLLISLLSTRVGDDYLGSGVGLRAVYRIQHHFCCLRCCWETYVSGTSVVSLGPWSGMMSVFEYLFDSCMVNSAGINFVDVKSVGREEAEI